MIKNNILNQRYNDVETNKKKLLLAIENLSCDETLKTELKVLISKINDLNGENFRPSYIGEIAKRAAKILNAPERISFFDEFDKLLKNFHSNMYQEKE